MLGLTNPVEVATLDPAEKGNGYLSGPNPFARLNRPSNETQNHKAR